VNRKLTLRERKKYITMNSILNEFLLGLQTKDFHEILIEEICDKVNISKVTFFRYFSTKEEVLDYFVMRWCYQRSVEINRGTYFGRDGIFHVFLSAAKIPNAEKILVSLIHHYSKLKEKPSGKKLTEHEKHVISQDSDEGIEISVLSLEQIFFHYVSQMPNIIDDENIIYVRQLIALFYGIPFQVHIQMLGSNALPEAYKDSLLILLND